MIRFMVMDNEENVLGLRTTENGALDLAHENVDGAVEDVDDGKTVEVGVYKLVKTVQAVRKTTKTVITAR